MVRIQPEVKQWLREQGKGEVSAVNPVGGGSIHQAVILQTQSGDSYFLKQNLSAPAGMFQREAQGLRALQCVNGPFTPWIYLVGKSFLLLEDLQPGPPIREFWELYGRQMARLHLNTNNQFGFKFDNYIGRNPQFNNWTKCGFEFYRYRRFLPQIIWARNQSLICSQDVKNLEKILLSMKQIFPRQKASLLHGDLWSGNLVTDKHGLPTLVDPAVYFGWAEADLAMAALFGSYPEEFYKAYQEIRPLEPGFLSRFPIYNIYHLLNHLNMFGKSYLGSLREILKLFEEL